MDALTPGRPWPLGATPLPAAEGGGINFAVASGHATAIDLCLFDATGRRETARLRLPGRTQDVWHGRLQGAGPGLVYGLRAHGPWRPARGHRFNPHKLLLDPYAREIVGAWQWNDVHFGADRQHPAHMDSRDNGPWALKARVVAPLDRRGRPPRRDPVAEPVILELHVKGYTQQMPGVPPALRGTYAGLASPASIARLRALGVTTVQLLPVHAHLDEERLAAMRLSNYWGYNTLGFFAPHAGYAASGPAGARAEFRDMVRRLHDAGLEVVLDVVFNHTAEGDETGPTLSWRGLDNAASYRPAPGNAARYENLTGCGNTLDLRRPRVLQMVMDSLRYWVEEMEVDGFRFDLAPVLGRGDHGFDPHAPFFTALAQDPVLAGVRRIAEPWDLGLGGYQVGGFPAGWMEWNDRFRDGQRAFWLGVRPGADAVHACTRGEFAQRLCGSSDLYQPRRRVPGESVNFITAHDGFTLADLVSFEARRNEANGEDNRDGHAHNLNWNAGAEGPTDDPTVRERRRRLQRALLATVLLAQGTPMLCAGDEIGRSQGGNNNAYCQDGPISWIDWAAADADLQAYTRRVIAIRRVARPFADAWYSGLPDRLGLHDLGWFEPDGTPLQGAAWNDPGRRALACLIGHPGGAPGGVRAPLLMLVNAGTEPQRFWLPAGVWRAVLDSTAPDGAGRFHGQGEAPLDVAAHGLMLLASAGVERELMRALEVALAPLPELPPDGPDRSDPLDPTAPPPPQAPTP